MKKNDLNIKLQNDVKEYIVKMPKRIISFNSYSVAKNLQTKESDIADVLSSFVVEGIIGVRYEVKCPVCMGIHTIGGTKKEVQTYIQSKSNTCFSCSYKFQDEESYSITPIYSKL